MPYDTNPPPTIAAQATALHALAHLAEAHPDLPGAYVTAHSVFPKQIDIQLDSPAALETWRATLGIATDSVTLSHYDARNHLEFTAPLGTTRLRVYASVPARKTSPEGGEQ